MSDAPDNAHARERDETAQRTRLVRRHLRVGFTGLLVFVVLGAALEALHAFKSPLYLDVGNETRRLMWRLAHAHGTLLSLVNVIYALALERHASIGTRTASRGLVAALVLLPLGFFAGGVSVQGGDPSVFVVLVPIGALALAVSLGAIVRALAAPQLE